MDQAETQAFADLGTKVDALVGAVTSLSTEVAAEKTALDAALAANDSPGIVAAAQALSAKLDAGLAAASAALNPPPPETPPADTAQGSLLD